MNSLKKFSVETHKGWRSFQAWIKKWNKIMAVIFSALVIILLLLAVIVNALDAYEEAQDDLDETENKPNMTHICRWSPINSCQIYCNSVSLNTLSIELGIQWTTNIICQTKGLNIEITPSVRSSKFTIQNDWLTGNFKINELKIDLKNIFEIRENAYTIPVFQSMNKLILTNLHLDTMDVKLIRNLFLNHHFESMTITKKSYLEQLPNGTMTNIYYDSVFSAESNGKCLDCNHVNLDDISLLAGMSKPLIISLAIVGCILSFALGFLIHCNRLTQKNVSNEIKKAKCVIFLVENNVASFTQKHSSEGN